MALAMAGMTATAAERVFDFSQTKENETPSGFRSAVTGEGKPGEWKVILDDVPASLPTLYTESPAKAKRRVLAQTARDKTDEHFPLLVCEDGIYGDFTFSAKLKTVAGDTDRMAGLAFRIQDEKNYYVARISSSGNNVRFYKFVGGMRSAPIGPEIPVPVGVWHELKVECRGNQLRIWFNGREAMPMLTDPSFLRGKLGFWVKSDSESYFADARVLYTPQERLAESLVKAACKEYPKLRALKLYAVPAGKSVPEVIASGNPADVGQTGGDDEKVCLEAGTPFVGKGRESVTVMMPLRDRNGDVAAAVKITMNTFFGQTEQNALNRARPIVQEMERRVGASNDPL